jgi:hypothetical protein
MGIRQRFYTSHHRKTITAIFPFLRVQKVAKITSCDFLQTKLSTELIEQAVYRSYAYF